MFYLNCNSYLETSRTDRALYTSLKGSKSYCVSVPALRAPWSELEKRVFSTSGVYLFRIWVPAFAGPSTRCYCAVNKLSKFLRQPWGFWNLFFIFQSLLPVKIFKIYIENYYCVTTSSSHWFSTCSFLHSLLVQTAFKSLIQDSFLHITQNPPQWTATQLFVPQMYKRIENKQHLFKIIPFYFEIIVVSHTVVRNDIVYSFLQY